MPYLADLAQSSGIPVRKLRYVLDHGLLPGAQDNSQGRGTARAFTFFGCFVIVVAALMLEAGLRRSLVRDCLAALSRNPKRRINEVPLYRAFAHDELAQLEIGDWRFARLIVTPTSRPALDTGWLALSDVRPPDDPYTPLVCVVLDLGQIRSLIPRFETA
jgi:hypothetical protein